MSLVSRMTDNIKNLAVTDEKAWNTSLWNLFGSQSLSGENVTEHTALTYSAVWNAVQLISGTVSTLPLHLCRKDQRKTIFVTEKKLFRVLHDRFNPYMTAQVGKEVIMVHVLLWGNGYVEIVRNGMGEIVELWPIPPHRVKPVMKDGILVYEISVGGEIVTLGRDKILHITGLGYDGFVGYSVIAMARKSIGLGMAMETYGSLFFGQGTHPGVIISHPGTLSPTSKSNLEASLREEHSGLGKTHRMMLLDEGMKIEKIQIPNNDSQFLESRQFQIPEIARWFNLPPHKLKDLTKSSFNNIESEQISFVTDSILPWLIRLEQQYNLQLLTESEQFQQNIYTRHNVEGLLRGDAKSRSEYYKNMWGSGFITQNEVRALENLDPHKDQNADELFIMTNMIPLSKIDQYLEQQGKQPGGQPNETETQPVQTES